MFFGAHWFFYPSVNPSPFVNPPVPRQSVNPPPSVTPATPSRTPAFGNNFFLWFLAMNIAENKKCY